MSRCPSSDRPIAPNATNLQSLIFRQKPQSLKRLSAHATTKPSRFSVSRTLPLQKSTTISQTWNTRKPSALKKTQNTPLKTSESTPAPFNLSTVQNMIFETQMDLLNRVIVQQRTQELELARLREKLRLVDRQNDPRGTAWKENYIAESPLSKTTPSIPRELLLSTSPTGRSWMGVETKPALSSDLRESISDLRAQMAQLRAKNEMTIRLFSPPGGH